MYICYVNNSVTYPNDLESYINQMATAELIEQSRFCDIIFECVVPFMCMCMHIRCSTICR